MNTVVVINHIKTVLVVQHLVTLDEATRILRLFKQKKHADKSYHFDLQDLGAPMKRAIELTGLGAYNKRAYDGSNRTSAWWSNDAYLLRVYRVIPAR